MSQENADNSWYKYLESVQKASASTSTSTSTGLLQRDVILAKIQNKESYPQIKLCLLHYECLICMNHILEVRLENMCEHEFCVNCVPRIHCREDCKPWVVHSISADDLKSHQRVIDRLKSNFKVVKVGKKNKRRYPDYEDEI